MLDAADINASYDLLPVVELDTQVKKQGAWFIGPCPFCGGVDRFNLTHTPGGWRWFCRRCGGGKYHTPIDYVMERNKTTFIEAIQQMTGAAIPAKAVLPTQAERVAEIGKDLHRPSKLWQERGRAFVDECRSRLYSPDGAKALEWMTGRGLLMSTLARYNVGFNPGDRFESLAEWGLDGDGKVWLARGIVLPCYGLGDDLYYIKTRRALPAGSKDKKYVKVRGSKPGVFGWGNLRGAWFAVVTEGEIDCMTLDQQAGDLAGVGTFGSATDSPLNVDPDLLRWHYLAQHTGVVFDNDDTGRDGAMRFQEHLPRVTILSLPEGVHDINDYHQAGGDLADWLSREAERLEITHG